jgi:transposase
MPPTTPPLVFNHNEGEEIETKYKEAIHQLYGFTKIPVKLLMTQYKLGRSTIKKILRYDTPERSRISRSGRPSLLTDTQVDEIIEYLSESWEHRILDFEILRNELELECSVITLERRLK